MPKGCQRGIRSVSATADLLIAGKECKMAFGEKANLVASGTIVEIDVPNQLVHNVPLGEGNIRVAVNCALKGDSPLPIPCEKSVRNSWGCHWIAKEEGNYKGKISKDFIQVYITNNAKVLQGFICIRTSSDVQSYLFRLVKSQQRDQVIGFMDRTRTTHDPRDGNLRSDYITKCLKQMSIDSIFLIPYNPG
ncbi:unnamed protein product [Prunus armeniaca]